MADLIKVLLLSAVLALATSTTTLAESDAAAKSPQAMNCPMMGDMSAMHKDLGSMMGDVDDMMKNMRSRSMRMRMQKMHDQMAGMMANMEKMGGMHGMMMHEGKPADAQPAAPDKSQPSPEDHKAHHPGQ